MIVLGNKVFLAENEVLQLARLTGERPEAKMTISGYNRYLDQHLARLTMETRSEKSRRNLIEQQRLERILDRDIRSAA